MNRRDFLRALGIGVAAAIAPLAVAKQAVLPLELPVLASYSHFNPAYEYGDYAVFNSADWNNHSVFTAVREILDEQVVQVIPAAYRDKIQWIYLAPNPTSDDPYGQRGSVGWKYAP